MQYLVRMFLWFGRMEVKYLRRVMQVSRATRQQSIANRLTTSIPWPCGPATEYSKELLKF